LLEFSDAPKELTEAVWALYKNEADKGMTGEDEEG
jgi:hypothetical protein